jgi:hypothetical protein
MSSMHSTRLPAAFAALLAGIVAAALYPAPAEAIPAFARKHNLTCTACHTKPPRLNEFGEAFHMAGLQIPMVRDGERHRKHQIGHIWSETDLLNIFAARTHGNVVESVSGTTEPETRLGFPQEVELYLAGTLTEDISYFFVIGGDDDHFGIGHEFHVMANLEPLFRGGAANGGDHDGHDGHAGDGPMIMGPMLMVGKIDPSSFFSYPTNRQLIATIPGQGDHGDRRLALRPYAAASKFFGIETMDGREVEVTRPVLYNTDGDAGIDFHMMIDRFLLQAGVMQGIGSGMRNSGRKVDPYLMARMNFGGERYLSGSVSALAQWGLETARVGGEPVDWRRHGIAANVKYRLLDIYGAAIRDRIRGLPDGIPAFDDEAWGLTVQTDYLLTDPWLLSLRYDYMDAGGFIDERASGRVVTLQARYYFRDNISFWFRDSWNAGNAGANPLQNFRHLFAAGVDLAF